MEARPDPRTRDLVRKGLHVGPAPGHAGRRWTRDPNLRDICGPEHRSHHPGDAATLYAMRAGILRVHRRIGDRLPSRLAVGSGVAIDIAVADRRDRSPEIILVLGVQHRDDRV